MSPPGDTPADSSFSAPNLVLYSFWQSSCSWRVRFALNLKGLPYEYRAVNLDKGEQHSPEFERLNPLHYVPVLVDGDIIISDSHAIILYLEEKYPSKALLPADPHLRALNLQVASVVTSSIQPLHMLAVMKYVEEKVGPEERLLCAQFYIEQGFLALEKLLQEYPGAYATGEKAYMADVFLAPQIAVAMKRFNVDMVNLSDSLLMPVNHLLHFTTFVFCVFIRNSSQLNPQSKFPALLAIYESCKALPEFQASSPDKQPDAVP